MNIVSRFWVFRSWGRVGTTIGGNKLEAFHSKDAAKMHFKSLFQEKTGNEWESRSRFIKRPNLFYPLELDYGDDESESLQKLRTFSTNSFPAYVLPTVFYS